MILDIIKSNRSLGYIPIHLTLQQGRQLLAAPPLGQVMVASDVSLGGIFTLLE
ncbi:hypothetical protein [Vibrio sinensis]|uniref:hypothetical protein n=1 Tax=Vibrio sinensis TaxID=2302434 RepID=UPI001403B096|nr:hypothetical protein [Vibrio sinensis]